MVDCSRELKTEEPTEGLASTSAQFVSSLEEPKLRYLYDSDWSPRTGHDLHQSKVAVTLQHLHRLDAEKVSLPHEL